MTCQCNDPVAALGGPYELATCHNVRETLTFAPSILAHSSHLLHLTVCLVSSFARRLQGRYQSPFSQRPKPSFTISYEAYLFMHKHSPLLFGHDSRTCNFVPPPLVLLLFCLILSLLNLSIVASFILCGFQALRAPARDAWA